MVGIILATHGRFAEGIKMSGEMVFGPQADSEAVCLLPEMGPDDFDAQLQQAISKMSNQQEILFLVDLWGGTPFNRASFALQQDGHERWAVVTGLNLPMLIMAYTNRMGMESAHELASSILTDAREGVRVQPETLDVAAATHKPENQSAPQAASGAMPPGTVVGDGKIKVGLVRIDTRLLHGQVATGWTRAINPNRILVVSDAVAHDEMRRTLITQAAPPGVKVNVIPIQKLIDIWHDTRFGGVRALILFENPHDLLRALEGGVDGLERVNVGSMSHTEGKTAISDAISVNEHDIACFKQLADRGIELFAQKVPSGSSTDFWDLAQRAGMV
ncbi:MAG: PTS sugar transporter subunit IIB [Atopobiaceae bacterium]|nr:PTS sugar transporter subunit IIB [Atopobiaceae bacterium]